MALSDWMSTYLKDAAQDMREVAESLNSTRSFCCKEKARFKLWDNEDEARLHRRVTSVVKKIDEILIDFDRASNKQTGVDK